MFSDAINSVMTRVYLQMKREEGQTFVEYSLIGVLVALAVVVAVTALGTKISGVFTTLTSKI
jgi:pilus assembly protein Flp/PilA